MTDCKLMTRTPRPFAFMTRSADMAGMGQAMGECFGAVAEGFAKAGVVMEGPAYAHHTAYDDNSATFSAGFSAQREDVEKLRAAGLEVGETAGGEVMVAMHTGPYDTLMQTYAAIEKALQAKGLKGTVDMWEAYLSPPETAPENTQTEVIWPIAGPA